MTAPQLIDRGEIAAILSISCKSVANNEKRLGILPAKVKINDRLVRYKRRVALCALKKRGLME